MVDVELAISINILNLIFEVVAYLKTNMELNPIIFSLDMICDFYISKLSLWTKLKKYLKPLNR